MPASDSEGRPKTTEKVWSAPGCWAVRTYKHQNISSADYKKMEEVFSRMVGNTGNVAGRRDIAYGNYDRIQMIPINTFSDFTDQSHKTYTWYGNSQAMLLFPLEEDTSKRLFVWGNIDGENKPRVLLQNGREVNKLSGFFGVSFCYLSDEVQNAELSYIDMLHRCRDSVRELVDVYNEMLDKSGKDKKLHGSVTAEVFGSFSSAEIVILWSSRQYTDMLYLIDCIRDFRFTGVSTSVGTETENDGVSLLRTTYTMISFPDIVRGDEEADPSLSEILGSAHIQFVMQNGTGEKSFPVFKEFLNQCLKNAGALAGVENEGKDTLKLRRCAGEYDLMGEVGSKYLPRLFSNPKNWKGEEDPSWEPDPDDKNYYYCSVHHPVFRQYVQYSFTRLSYDINDLPTFTNSSSGDQKADPQILKDWHERKKKISELKSETGMRWDEKLSFWRSDLIRRIQKEHEPEFRNLIQDVRERIPDVSNLCAELHQLFSDYVQCCCSSADHLWIDDYNELFQQTLERIRQSILSIDVWKDIDDRDEQEEEWKNARESLKGIRKLMQALNQQTSHITASGKLFFKEQEVHFGYTAQHDLVIHAYYDIIKHLIQQIYSYTDVNIQSRLYPLVNFCPEDIISSQIYTEESAEIFLQDYKKTGNLQLRPRVMAIYIPLDGMDNLMHYLPMLIHEVYHYAAPRDRKKRNLILAKIVIYQTLRRIFLYMFSGMLSEYLKNEGKGIVMDSETFRELQKQWQEISGPALYKVLQKKEEAVYDGLKSNFFWNKGVSECDDKLKEVVPVLRNWFTIWLQNWLNDNKNRYESLKEAALPAGSGRAYENFSDLFPDVFAAVEKSIHEEKEKLQEKYDGKAIPEQEKVFLNILDIMAEQVGKKPEENTDFLQRFASDIANYVNKSVEINKLLECLDEVFPDMAMVVLTRMPAHGYMLQIALNLDSQLFQGKNNYTDQVRFASVLGWIFRRERKEKPDLDETALLQEALKEFRNLYIAAYRVAACGSKITATVNKKADEWSNTFENMYSAFYSRQGPDSFGHILEWTEILIGDMVGCLDRSGMDPALRDKHRELFVDPYRRYLEVLKMEDEKQAREELLKLSIQTILKFQRRQSLRQMNQEFEEKAASVPAILPGAVPEEYRIQLLEPWQSRIIIVEQYYSAIKYALGRLYQYREEEGIPASTGMWYRGITNGELAVLPSGFVHFKEDASRLRTGSPSAGHYYYMQAQLHNYEVFRYSAEGAGTLTDPSRYYSTINYLTLMQHYGQHTNLIDWSEDAFASSYFALEDEVNINDRYPYEQKKKRDEILRDKDKNAALYILDPVRFNKACEEIEHSRFFSDRIRKPKRKNTNQAEIPNLSIKENQNQPMLGEYHDLYQSIPVSPEVILVTKKKPGVFGATAGTSGTKPGSTEPILHKNSKDRVSLRDMAENLHQNQKLDFHLPRAVYTAKMNPRIQAQSGLFVACSLKSLPVIWEDHISDYKKEADKVMADLFYYQSLESIQDYYLKTTGNKPFLMKIIIPARVKEELGKTLYRFGVSKEKIYPELENNRNR